MSLVVPEHVQWDILREKQAEADIEAARYWTAELKRIDPHLSIVWIPERMDHADPDLEPGRWHIKRKNPETLDSYWPIVGDHGEYREPGSWMLDKLQGEDLHNPRVTRDREEAKQRLREAKRRARAREAEGRRDELAHNWRAAKRVAGDGGMTKRKWHRQGSKPKEAA